jgi:RNA polymerase sigma-70 factor (ECF subfamily)
MENTKTTNYELCQNLYNTHCNELFGFCVSKVRNREEAIDIVQDAFVKLWSMLQKGEQIAHPRGLLFTIVRNKIIDEYRSVTVQRVFPLSDELLNSLSTSSQEIVDESDLKTILRMINTLPESSREVLLYRYVDDMNVQDIADLLEIPANTVSQRIKRAMAATKKLLNIALE